MEEGSDGKYSMMSEKSPLWKKMTVLEDPNNRGSEVKANDMEGNKTQEDWNQSCSDRIPRRHDRTRSTRHTERNHNYDGNVNGSNSDQMSSQADHTCFLAVHRQRRKRQVCQISEHIEDRVERTESKDITSHGCRRKISLKYWIHTRHSIPFVQIIMNRLTRHVSVDGQSSEHVQMDLSSTINIKTLKPKTLVQASHFSTGTLCRRHFEFIRICHSK